MGVQITAELAAVRGAVRRRGRVSAVAGPHRGAGHHAATTTVELWAGRRICRSTVISRSAEIPASAKSAALGRQLDPAAFVVHRAWVGPMVLLVLDDPDDPTPYWLVSAGTPNGYCPRFAAEVPANGAADRPQAAQSVQIITPFFSLASRLR